MTQPTPSDAAPPLSLDIALMLSESENPDLATSACLRCAHSTALTLAWPRGDDERPKPADLVVFCGQMHRDITTLVQRCSGFQPKS